MRKLSLSFIALILTALSAFAQIQVRVPSAVALDEQFNLQFVVEGDKPSDFKWECPSDFKLIWGPQVGSSSSVSIINGKRTSSRQTSYTYILMPTKEGTFTLPSATATVKKQTLSSSATSIKVVKSGAASSSSEPSRENAYAISGEDIFLRMELSRNKVVVGESITADIKLYQRVDIAGFEDVHFPSFDGFWNQLNSTSNNIEFHRETLGEEIFNVATLRSYTLIPQQSGDLQIDPAEIVCLVRVRNRNASTGSIFDSFFQDEYSTVRKRVATKAVTVHVGKLPEPQPADFCGGVGRFTLSASLSKDSLATHEAASLSVILRGKGNLALVQAPKVNFPPDFEVYDVKVSEGAGGAKVFEYPFIPRHHGDYSIAGVGMSYYDPSSGKYVSASHEPLKIKVVRGAGSEDDSALQGGSSSGLQRALGEDVRNIGSDIRYISTGNPALRNSGTFFVGSTLFFVLLALIVAAALVVYVVLHGRRLRQGDVVGQRRKSASKTARKRLARAGEYLKDHLSSAFYEELHKALVGFVSDRLVLDQAHADKEGIESALVQGGVEVSLAKEFVALLDECEYARYSPDLSNAKMDQHYNTALELISSIERALKAPRVGVAKALAAFLVLGAAAAVSSESAFAAGGVENICDSLWVSGVNAYGAADYQKACTDWLAIEALGQESPRLYTNIGSAYFKDGDLAHAVLYYERALKLDPSFEDAEYDLRYVRTFLQDKIETVPEFFLTCWLRSVRESVGSDVWAVLFLVMLAVALAGVLLLLLARSSSWKRAGFAAGIVALLLSLSSLAFALGSKADYMEQDSAVVLSAVSVVRSSPDAVAGSDLFVLHEGTLLEIRDSVGEWCNVELADGRQGWVRMAEIEVI